MAELLLGAHAVLQQDVRDPQLALAHQHFRDATV